MPRRNADDIELRCLLAGRVRRRGTAVLHLADTCRQGESACNQSAPPPSTNVVEDPNWKLYSMLYERQLLAVHDFVSVQLNTKFRQIGIGADFAGALGVIAPAVKILRGRRPAVTREVAPLNHGCKAPVIHGGHASDDEKCFITRRVI